MVLPLAKLLKYFRTDVQRALPNPAGLPLPWGPLKPPAPPQHGMEVAKAGVDRERSPPGPGCTPLSGSDEAGLRSNTLFKILAFPSRKEGANRGPEKHFILTQTPNNVFLNISYYY